MPNFFHVIPVADDAMLDWSLDFKHTALLLGLFANIYLFLVKTYHDAGNFGAANNCAENRAWCIVSRKSSLAGA